MYLFSYRRSWTVEWYWRRGGDDSKSCGLVVSLYESVFLNIWWMSDSTDMLADASFIDEFSPSLFFFFFFFFLFVRYLLYLSVLMFFQRISHSIAILTAARNYLCLQLYFPIAPKSCIPKLISNSLPRRSFKAALSFINTCLILCISELTVFKNLNIGGQLALFKWQWSVIQDVCCYPKKQKRLNRSLRLNSFGTVGWSVLWRINKSLVLKPSRIDKNCGKMRPQWPSLYFYFVPC